MKRVTEFINRVVRKPPLYAVTRTVPPHCLNMYPVYLDNKKAKQ